MTIKQASRADVQRVASGEHERCKANILRLVLEIYLSHNVRRPGYLHNETKEESNDSDN